MYNFILDRDKKNSFLVKIPVLVCDVDRLNNLESTFASADIEIEGRNFFCLGNRVRVQQILEKEEKITSKFLKG